MVDDVDETNCGEDNMGVSFNPDGTTCGTSQDVFSTPPIVVVDPSVTNDGMRKEEKAFLVADVNAILAYKSVLPKQLDHQTKINKSINVKFTRLR